MARGSSRIVRNSTQVSDAVLEDQCRERQQHDRAQEERREAEREPEARQDARLSEPARRPCAQSLQASRARGIHDQDAVAAGGPRAGSPSQSQSMRRRIRTSEHQHAVSCASASSAAARRRVAEAQFRAHVEAVYRERLGTRIEQVAQLRRALIARRLRGLDAEVDGLGRHVAQQARGHGERRAARAASSVWITTCDGTGRRRHAEHLRGAVAQQPFDAAGRRCPGRVARQACPGGVPFAGGRCAVRRGGSCGCTSVGQQAASPQSRTLRLGRRPPR